jgi:hypothetical protein
MTKRLFRFCSHLVVLNILFWDNKNNSSEIDLSTYFLSLKGQSHENFIYFFGIIQKLGSVYTLFILSVFKNIIDFVSNFRIYDIQRWDFIKSQHC